MISTMTIDVAWVIIRLATEIISSLLSITSLHINPSRPSGEYMCQQSGPSLVRTKVSSRSFCASVSLLSVIGKYVLTTF